MKKEKKSDFLLKNKSNVAEKTNIPLNDAEHSKCHIVKLLTLCKYLPGTWTQAQMKKQKITSDKNPPNLQAFNSENFFCSLHLRDVIPNSDFDVQFYLSYVSFIYFKSTCFTDLK